MKKILAAVLALLILQGCASMRGSRTDARQPIIRYAKNQIGKLYRYGQQDTNSGFDCSGLTQFAYKEAGINIPRTAREQYGRSQKIEKDRLEPADLVFFSTNGPGASHVGIFIGNGKFIHAPSAGKKVQEADLNNNYWKKEYFGAGTYLK